MMSLYDYRGFRVIATSVLPLGKDTLMYGSADAGRTVLKELPELNELMEKAAKYINMKGHRVGPDEDTVLFGPTDIEAHLGKDDNFYVLDTARLYPPESPSPVTMCLVTFYALLPHQTFLPHILSFQKLAFHTRQPH